MRSVGFRGCSVRGEYQSMRSGQCVPWHRVTHFTLCPLGQPEIAIGHEPRIEPWLTHLTIMACRSLKLDGVITAAGTYENETPKLLQRCLWKVGWISRNNLNSGQGESFFS